jgi:AcrR family transcriptional regulator
MIEQDGIDRLSMRTLAERLESGTATLYRHFASRQELVGHIVDEILGDVSIDVAASGRQDWQAILASGARSMYAVLTRFKGLPAVFADDIPRGPNSMRQRERFIAVLMAARFSPEIAALAYATIARFVLGFAIQADTGGNSESRLNLAIRDFARSGPVEQYPSLNAVADQLPFGLDQEFEFGLQLILSGLSSLTDHK